MEDSTLFPNDLTYESATNLQDLQKLEQMEMVAVLDDEIQFLSDQLEHLKKVYKKEQKIKIYNDIQDDQMYKELETQKTNSEDDQNQSIENSSIFLERQAPMHSSTLINGVKLEPNDFGNVHRIRNRTRGASKNSTNKSLFFEDEETQTGRKPRKQSDYHFNQSEVFVRNRVRSQVVRRRKQSAGSFLARNLNQKFLMNSGLSPQVPFNPKIEINSQMRKERLDEVQKQFIALNKRIAREKRVRLKTKKPALNAHFDVKKEEFEAQFVGVNIEIQKTRADNERLLDQIKRWTEKINQKTEEINRKNVTKSDFTRRLSELNLSTFKLTN